MSNLWVWLRNKGATGDAYTRVSTQFGDDLTGQPIFTALRKFADAPMAPIAIPVLLLEEFNAGQKRVSRRRKIRAGSGALFGVAILIPSLAYAGVLPTPVSRIVQRVFNVISLPIQIPSVAVPRAKPSQSVPDSVELTPGTATEVPVGSPDESSTPESTTAPTPTDEATVEPSSAPSSELSPNLPITGDLGTSGGEITGQLGGSGDTPGVPEPVSSASPTPSESDPSAGD